MKIKVKLIVGFALLLAIMIAITSFGYDRLSRMKDRMDDFYDNRFQKAQMLIDVRGNINDIGRNVVDLLLGTSDDPQAGIDSINDRLQSIDEQFAAFEDKPLEPDERQMLESVLWDSGRYGQFARQFANALGAGNSEQARDLYDTLGRARQDAVVHSLNSLVTFQQRTLDREMTALRSEYSQSVSLVAVLTAIGLLLSLLIILWVFPSITKGLNLLDRMAERFGKGRLRSFARFEVAAQDELGDLARVFKRIALDLHDQREREAAYNTERERQSAMDAQLARVTELLREAPDPATVSQAFIAEFAPAFDAAYGAVYLIDDTAADANRLVLYGAYAAAGSADNRPAEAVRIGEGLTGQCAVSGRPIRVSPIPPGYIAIASGLGSAEPKHLLLHPIVHEGRVVGVVELASLSPFVADTEEMLDALCDKFGAIVGSIRARQRVEELLRESQAQSEELQVQSEELMSQQEELRMTNEKLEAQRNALKRSEERLKHQQEELEHANSELTAKTIALETHVRQIEAQNRQIAKANAELERQAVQLAQASKYKSEFLANMSHELRTPLNSLLILSEFLTDNRDGNLTAQQLEYIRTIRASGTDLLKMIDDILDLSKVDAGKMDVQPEWTVLEDMIAFMKITFGPVAEQKGLELVVEAEEGAPDAVWTDGHRLKQILRNLLSNALKFTHEGSVEVRIRRTDGPLPDAARRDVEERAERGAGPASYVAFVVRDTGIGIPEDKRELIFEAFSQADGTTSRQYGGTGLGLTISRELARLLGGRIELRTEPGRGSEFTLLLPIVQEQPSEAGTIGPEGAIAAAGEAQPAAQANGGGNRPDAPAAYIAASVERPADDRHDLQADDKSLLIIEDDLHFATIVLEMARSRGFKGVVALRGDEGLALARELKPDAVILDIQLPVTDGWAILHELKGDPATRHIPVHVISVTDEAPQGLRMGALGHLRKPVTHGQLEQALARLRAVLERRPKQLLLVESDPDEREALASLIGSDDVAVVAVPDAAAALALLRERAFDCAVVHPSLPDEGSVALLRHIGRTPELRAMPVILHGSDSPEDEEAMRAVRQAADSVLLKDVRSPERLLEETALILHRVEADLPEDKRSLLRRLHRPESAFLHKKILLVDDDARNVFALSSVLKDRHMHVVTAENGREALDRLNEHPDVDLVLMDVMMPDMDGYEAMRRIRGNADWAGLPIIALTAKAMKDDRNKCIEAGASDYLAKPVHTEQLLSLMRVWLYR